MITLAKVDLYQKPFKLKNFQYDFATVFASKGGQNNPEERAILNSKAVP